MFQGYNQTVKFQAPFRGMDTTVDNNIEYAKYLQNMLVSDNNTCRLRHGTRLIAEFPFNANRIYRSQIAVMSHLGVGGESEKIVYQNYLINLPYINIQDNVQLDIVQGKVGSTRLVIDISGLIEEQKTFLKERIYDGEFIYVKQASLSEGADIYNITSDNDTLAFDIDFPDNFFDRDYTVDPAGINAFELWFERAGLYQLEDDVFNEQPLVEDLDPNVIVTHINYQGKLIITNGVDPVQVYDGTTMQKLQGDASVLVDGGITQNARVLTFSIPQFFQAEMQKYFSIGSVVNLVTSTTRQENTVANIAYAAPANNKVAVTLTLAQDPPENVRTILYKKTVPAFSFITVANDRLWALAEGRSYKNKFRPSNLAMKAYYASDRKSVDGWFNQKTNEIEFVDLTNNTVIADNLEAIIAFQGKVLFLGRETTQVWIGEDPTTIDDGQNISFPDFQWEMTLPVGILQKSLFAEIPNDFVFLSKYGIVSVSSLNEYRQLSVSYNFANGINQHLNAQLAFVETDRDYRDLNVFVYPYGRFIGFKLKYNCLIYQLRQQGAWSVFSENFADNRSVYYDPVSQDLLLGMDDGVLLAYADKIETESYEEYARGEMIWRIHYNWIYPSTTWNNAAIFVACRTLAQTNIDIKIYTDYTESENIEESIVVEQEGGLYDNAEFGVEFYANREGEFPYEMIRFSADSIMLVLSGRSSEQFIFDKLFLAGGALNAN